MLIGKQTHDIKLNALNQFFNHLSLKRIQINGQPVVQALKKINKQNSVPGLSHQNRSLVSTWRKIKNAWLETSYNDTNTKEGRCEEERHGNRKPKRKSMRPWVPRGSYTFWSMTHSSAIAFRLGQTPITRSPWRERTHVLGPCSKTHISARRHGLALISTQSSFLVWKHGNSLNTKLPSQ